MKHASLSNLQKEILKIYSTDIDELDLKGVQTILAEYFANKSIKEADKIWTENELSNQDMDRWLDGK